jgi:predicted nuclease with RNAse H fold
MVVLGIDLRSSPSHPSALAALKDDGALELLEAFSFDDELLELALTRQPALIAIGTPLGLPLGLQCLESVCQCCDAKAPRKRGREAELELARMGISCFFTSKGSIIRNLVYRGVALKKRLEKAHHTVVETYPHATKVMLFGDKVPPKNSARSLAYLRERLPTLVKGLEPHLASLDKNACDAVLNAYTGLLHCRELTHVLGNPQEGEVVVPRQA